MGIHKKNTKKLSTFIRKLNKTKTKIKNEDTSNNNSDNN